MTKEDIANFYRQGQTWETSAKSQEEGSSSVIWYHQQAAGAYFKAATQADLESGLGPHHQRTLAIRDNAATARRDSGDYASAIPYSEETVARYRISRGATDDLTIDAERRLAECYLRNKQYKQAIQLYFQIVENGISAGKSQEILCQYRVDWATALLESGMTEGGLDAYGQTLTIAEGYLPQTNLEVLRLRYYLAKELIRAGRYSEAKAKLRDNVRILGSGFMLSQVQGSDFHEILEKSNAALKTCLKASRGGQGVSTNTHQGGTTSGTSYAAQPPPVAPVPNRTLSIPAWPGNKPVPSPQMPNIGQNPIGGSSASPQMSQSNTGQISSTQRLKLVPNLLNQSSVSLGRRLSSFGSSNNATAVSQNTPSFQSTAPTQAQFRLENSQSRPSPKQQPTVSHRSIKARQPLSNTQQQFLPSQVNHQVSHAAQQKPQLSQNAAPPPTSPPALVEGPTSQLVGHRPTQSRPPSPQSAGSLMSTPPHLNRSAQDNIAQPRSNFPPTGSQLSPPTKLFRMPGASAFPQATQNINGNQGRQKYSRRAPRPNAQPPTNTQVPPPTPPPSRPHSSKSKSFDSTMPLNKPPLSSSFFPPQASSQPTQPPHTTGNTSSSGTVLAYPSNQFQHTGGQNSVVHANPSHFAGGHSSASAPPVSHPNHVTPTTRPNSNPTVPNQPFSSTVQNLRQSQGGSMAVPKTPSPQPPAAILRPTPQFSGTSLLPQTWDGQYSQSRSSLQLPRPSTQPPGQQAQQASQPRIQIQTPEISQNGSNVGQSDAMFEQRRESEPFVQQLAPRSQMPNSASTRGITQPRISNHSDTTAPGASYPQPEATGSIASKLNTAEEATREDVATCVAETAEKARDAERKRVASEREERERAENRKRRVAEIQMAEAQRVEDRVRKAQKGKERRKEEIEKDDMEIEELEREKMADMGVNKHDWKKREVEERKTERIDSKEAERMKRERTSQEANARKGREPMEHEREEQENGVNNQRKHPTSAQSHPTLVFEDVLEPSHQNISQCPKSDPGVKTDAHELRKMPGRWIEEPVVSQLSDHLPKPANGEDAEEALENIVQAEDATPALAREAKLLPQVHRHYKPFFTKQAGPVNSWFGRLRRNALQMLHGFEQNERKVKIAVLDTGIAWRRTGSSKVPKLITRHRDRLKLGKEVDESLDPGEDKVGHGTHCAGIILQVCPYADVHVYRVAQDDKGIDPKHVADALEDAIQENIDIVSMSFGWYDQDKHLQEVIEKAKDKGILMFAAHSNSGEWSDGGRFGRTFPARADEVIAIDSSDADGRPSSFNPSFESPMVRFIALGESVRSAYPINFPNDGDEEGYRRMSGNSVAAPVAAGIAGLILEFARQEPLCFEHEIEANIKKVRGMKRLFADRLSVQPKIQDSDAFFSLDINKLFYCNEDFGNGGNWWKTKDGRGTPRLQAVTKILETLRREFDSSIGLVVEKKIQEKAMMEWRKMNASESVQGEK